MTSAIKAIFFDIDQTLVDYDGACRHAASEFVKSHPELKHVNGTMFNLLWTKHREKKTWGRLDGREKLSDMREKRMSALVQDLGLEISDTCTRAWSVEFSNLALKYCRAFDDAVSFLDRIKDIRMGIITNGEAKTQASKLNNSGLVYSFSPFVTSVEWKVAKPSRDLYLAALRGTGLLPHECLMIGDSLDLDYVPARSAGMNAVLLDRDGSNTNEEVKKIQRLDILSLEFIRCKKWRAA